LDEILRLEPLLDRLERLERQARVQAEAEKRLAESIAALDRALAEQAAFMETPRPVSPPPSRTPVLLPFEIQMSEAARRQTAEAPRVRVIKEKRADAI
jgi:hypothetical protein